MTSNTVEISLHVGAHKTATTHLQNILQKNQKRLSKQSIRYLGPPEIREDNKEIFSTLGRDLDAGAQNRHLEQVIGGNHRLAISEENIVGRATLTCGKLEPGPFYGQSLENLALVRSLLGDYPIHICLGVREPTSYTTSLYSQILLSQRFWVWEDFLNDTQPHRRAWSDMILPIIESHPWASVTLWRYEDYHKVFDQIMGVFLGPAAPKLKMNLKARQHSGLSQAAVDACTKWHAEGYRGPLGHLAREDFPVGGDNPRFKPWDQSVIVDSQSRYDADIEMLAAHPKITVLKPLKSKG